MREDVFRNNTLYTHAHTHTYTYKPCLRVSRFLSRWYFALISVSGVFSVTFSVIFAYVADITEENERSTAYGLVREYTCVIFKKLTKSKHIWKTKVVYNSTFNSSIVAYVKSRTLELSEGRHVEMFWTWVIACTCALLLFLHLQWILLLWSKSL